MNGSEVSVYGLDEFDLRIFADSLTLVTGSRVCVEDAFDVLSVLSLFLSFFVVRIVLGMLLLECGYLWEFEYFLFLSCGGLTNLFLCRQFLDLGLLSILDWRLGCDF